MWRPNSTNWPDIVVRETVDGQARRRRLLIQELGFLLGHQPGGDLLMGDLEVDAQSPQAGIEALALHVSLGDLETGRQVVGQYRERHVIGQPQPSDLDEFCVGNGGGVDGIANVLIERADGEFEQSGTRRLAGLGDVFIEAAERFSCAGTAIARPGCRPLVCVPADPS